MRSKYLTFVYGSPVAPIAGYRLSGTIQGVNISLLLDTGAAVTLLHEDTWLKNIPLEGLTILIVRCSNCVGKI